MKGIYSVKRKNGTAVYINYSPPGQPRVRELVECVDEGRYFGKRLQEVTKIAANRLVRRKAEIFEGRYEAVLPKKRENLTFARYVEETYVPLLRRSEMKEKPREVEIRRVTTGIVGRYFGNYRLDQIARSVIEQFVDKRLADGAGAAGINRDLARLRHVLNDVADRDELKLRLPRIPWRKLMRKEQPKSYRPMRDDEEPRLLEGLHDPIVRGYVEFLMHTGIRPQAALQLRWEHIDLEMMVITVPRDINKTDAYRVYPNSRVQEVLRGLYAFRQERLRQPDAYVFAHRNGKPRRSVRTAWAGACEAAGIKGLHVRGLRATAATRISEGGGTELDVKLHLGHSVGSMGVTGRYIDPHEEHRRRIAELTVRQRPANVVELRPRDKRGEGSARALL
jgi:integrase